MSIKDFLAILLILVVIIAMSMCSIHVTCKQAGTKTVVYGGNTVVCY